LSMINKVLHHVFLLFIPLALLFIIDIHVEAGNQSNEMKLVYINIENNMTKKYTIILKANNKTLTKVEVIRQVINKTVHIPIANSITIKIVLNNNITKAIKLPINFNNKYYISIVSRETKEYELILVSIQRENIRSIRKINITITPNPLGLGISLVRIEVKGDIVTLNSLIKAFKIGKYNGSLNYFLRTKYVDDTLDVILDTRTYPVINYNDTLSIDITSNNCIASIILTVKGKEKQPEMIQRDEEIEANYTITYTIGKSISLENREIGAKISSSDIIEYALLFSIILLLGVQKIKRLSRFSAHS